MADAETSSPLQLPNTQTKQYVNTIQLSGTPNEPFEVLLPVSPQNRIISLFSVGATCWLAYSDEDAAVVSKRARIPKDQWVELDPLLSTQVKLLIGASTPELLVQVSMGVRR